MHLVVIFGPQAVGKMAVGREVARRTPYQPFPLDHPHHRIDNTALTAAAAAEAVIDLLALPAR